MPDGPWYISASAVRDYLRITGRPVVEDGPEFERAERELIDVARNCVASDRQVRHLRSGLLQYRGPRPLKLRLIVSEAPAPEGTLPQLVQVLPQSPRVAPGQQHPPRRNKTRRGT